MKAYKVFLISAVLLCMAAGLHAADGAKPKLSSIRHNFERSGESVSFVLQNADGTAVSALPKPEIVYNEKGPSIRLTFSGVQTSVDNLSIEGVLVSSIEAQSLRDKTVVYVFLKKPARYYVKQSTSTGSLILGVFDAKSGGFWVRIDSPNWRSPEAAYPFWTALKRSAIMTCLLQDESRDYFLSTVFDADTLDRAKQTCKTAQAVIDSALDSDPLQACRPVASVCTIADSVGESDAAPTPPDKAKEIEAAVAKLSKDPAVVDAGVREKIISPAMRDIINKYGQAAIPSLAIALTSKDAALRRSALITLAVIGGNNVAQVLIDGLADTEPVVRQEMLLALERLPITRAVLVALKSEINDKDKWARFFAARMLTRAWMPEAVPILIQSMADEEVRDEAATILQQCVSRQITSEAMAGLSEQETKKAINGFLAGWDADKEFLMPAPAPDISADMLGKIFSRIYPGDKVRCSTDDHGQIKMQRAGDKDAKPVSILQFMPVNLDDDEEAESVVLVAEDGKTPSAIAAIDGGDGTGDVMWVEAIDPAAATGGARASITDLDADGAGDIVLSLMTVADGGVRHVTLAICRPGTKGFNKIFSTESFKEEKPTETMKFRREIRSFIDFRGSAQSPRDLVLHVRTKLGEGDSAHVTETQKIYKWDGKAYILSETTVPPPSKTGDEDVPDGTPTKTEGGQPPSPDKQESTPVKQPKPEVAPQKPLQVKAGDKIELVAVKSDRKLHVYVNGELRKSYDAKFGAAQGDKEAEGDMKTPEGEFYICVKNPNSKYHLSLGISYPNKEDAARGLEKNLITKEQYDAIVAAIDKKTQPPWKTPLGGEIMIHGDAESREDTHGCIALLNDDMDELYKVVPEGTKVIIKP